MHCATNNYASTALDGFLQGVEKFGIPSRARGDKGGENIEILNYMRKEQGNFSAYIQGPSVHNQRIERLHYDTTHCVLSHFKDMFYFMEENKILERSNELHLFALHFVYLPRIQKSLNSFQEAWNHHQISTEGNKSPYQLWMSGMMDQNRVDQRGVRRFFESETNDMIGVDMSPSLGYMPNDLSTVELHDVKLNNDSSEAVVTTLRNKFDPLFDDKIMVLIYF